MAKGWESAKAPAISRERNPIALVLGLSEIVETFMEGSACDIEGPNGSDRGLHLNAEEIRRQVYAALENLPNAVLVQNSGLKIEWGPRTLTESWLWDSENNRLLIRRPFIIDEDTAALWRDKILEAYHVLKMAER